MQHLLSFFGKAHKFLTVSGLVTLFLCAPSLAYAQEAAKTKVSGGNLEQNKEIEALKERIGQLEQRFINMQSRLGTIESMAGRSGSSAVENRTASSPSFTPQNNSSENNLGGAAGQGNSQGQYGASSGVDGQQVPQQPRGGSYPVEESDIPAPVPKGRKPRRIDSDDGFSPFNDQSSLQPKQDRQGRQFAGNPAPKTMARRVSTRKMPAMVRAPAGFDTSSPKVLYQSSYRMLLKPDYGAAEQGFQYFLQQYPRDKRASNAQYWLGESYFVQKKYKQAASAYLKGYKRYPNSVKAADSFLKLGVSLSKLGQKQAACATIQAFPAKYPNASSYVRQRHRIVKSRAGC